MFPKLSVLFLFVSLPGLAQSNANAPSFPSPAKPSSPTSLMQPSGNERSPSAPTSVSTNSTAPALTLGSLLTEAQALYRQGNLDGALAKYQQLLQQWPKSPDAYAGVIRVYLQQKKVDEAARAANEALALSDTARIRTARAEVLFRQGKIEEAEKEWAGVINSGHQEPRAYLGLARVRRAIAMYKSAQDFIQKAHELDPTDPDIEERWVSTLPRFERIKYLEDALSGENKWDAEQRADIARYLDYLKERAKKKYDPCRLVSSVAHTETPLVRLLQDPKHLRGYGLTVELNGHKSSLLLDTGATGIVVRRAIAERAGVSSLSATKIWGIGERGSKDAYVGMADSIKIGALEFHNCPIEVMESHSVAGEDGLIGSDVFQDFLVDIDFPDEKLKLNELPRPPGVPEQNLALKNEEDDDQSEGSNTSPDPNAANANAAPSVGPQDRYLAPEMQAYTRFFRFGHDLLIPTKIGDVPPKLFLLDTGASTNYISPAAARDVTKVGADPNTTVRGISGSVRNVYSANKAVFEFGHLRQENQEIIAIDTTALSNADGTEVSGFLGFTTLRFLDVKIDYRDGLIDFSYDSKRWHF
jgi:tetratricopeptide (TPR) repeat protein